MRIFSHYQPIFSVGRSTVVFYEALGRGQSDTGHIIGPDQLIASALENATLGDLDRQFMDAAWQGWLPEHSNQLLSINIDVRALQADSADYLLKRALHYGTSPNTIILEICENPDTDTGTLWNFVQQCRAHGFLIAIDDLGKAHSNLDRIVTLNPDLVKLDRELIEGVHQDSHKRALVRSMVRFGEECGAQVVAEGIECWEDAFALLEQGIDLFQGYYFARPQPRPAPPEGWKSKVEILTKSFSVHRSNTIRELRRLRSSIEDIAIQGSAVLKKYSARQFDKLLSKTAKLSPLIECLYIVDELGNQLTETHFNANAPMIRSELFAPAKAGHNHSLKPWFTNLAHNGCYLSDLYTSQATGNECRTYSHWIENHSEGPFILCVDLSSSVAMEAPSSKKFHVEYYFEI